MTFEIIPLVSCIVKKDNKILLVHNEWGSKLKGWTLPCGHVKKNESLKVAVKRELLEETGLSPIKKLVFERVLQVKKEHSIIYNFIYSVESFEGELNPNGDPDNIITKVAFFELGEALEKIMYKDVQYAVSSIIEKSSQEPLFYETSIKTSFK